MKHRARTWRTVTCTQRRRGIGLSLFVVGVFSSLGVGAWFAPSPAPETVAAQTLYPAPITSIYAAHAAVKPKKRAITAPASIAASAAPAVAAVSAPPLAPVAVPVESGEAQLPGRHRLLLGGHHRGRGRHAS